MEEIATKFEDLAKKFPDYESDICDAINCIERATFSGVDKGKVQLEVAKNRLKEIDDLIASALSLENLSEDVNDRLMQCFVSIRPRLESNIEQLKYLIENPPKESIFPPIDDSEIYPKRDEKEEANSDNQNADEKEETKLENQNINEKEENKPDNKNANENTENEVAANNDSSTEHQNKEESKEENNSSLQSPQNESNKPIESSNNEKKNENI